MKRIPTSMQVMKDVKSCKSKKYSVDNSTTKAPSKASSHWSQGLKQSMKNPENIVLETEFCSVIKDKYPKAKKHFLIIAKEDITSMSSLKSTHVPLLEHIIDVGNDLVDLERKKDVKMVFKMGFHAVPSMALLHMHVISTDFDSACLKTKRHWNSFTTQFFRPADVILAQLKEKGSITVDQLFYKQLLEKSLKCHVCSFVPKNMPTLKDHIKTHFAS